MNTDREEEKNQKPTKITRNSRLLGKADVDQTKLKTILKGSKSNTKALQQRFRLCKSSFSVIEFILLKHNDNSVTPKRTRDLSFIERKKDDCGDYTIHSGSKDPGFFRYSMPVSVNCECRAFEPGRKYNVLRLGNKKTFYYKIEIPEKGKFEFDLTYEDVKNGVPNDKVYRFPIFVEDVYETKDSKNQQRVNKDIIERRISVKNVPVSPSQVNEGQIIVQYMKSGQPVSNAKRADEKWRFQFKWKKDKGPFLGGDVVVYHFKEDTINQTGFTRLLAYKENVQSKTVDMSDDLDFDGTNKTWHEHELKLDTLSGVDIDWIKEKSSEYDLSLALKLPGDGETPYLTYGKLNEKDDGLYVELTAPQGTYKMMMAKKTLKEGFKWPPK
jgi:hypothetical protein